MEISLGLLNGNWLAPSYIVRLTCHNWMAQLILSWIRLLCAVPELEICYKMSSFPLAILLFFRHQPLEASSDFITITSPTYWLRFDDQRSHKSCFSELCSSVDSNCLDLNRRCSTFTHFSTLDQHSTDNGHSWLPLTLSSSSGRSHVSRLKNVRSLFSRREKIQFLAIYSLTMTSLLRNSFNIHFSILYSVVSATTAR